MTTGNASREAEYAAWVNHLSEDCADCENGTPEPGDEDYVCPTGQALKAAWLRVPEESETPSQVPEDRANEFHLAVCQVLYKYMETAQGDLHRLATYAKMQVICGEALRSVVARSQLLSKSPTMADWSQADLLDLIQRADKADEARGPTDV